jgi:hypothetical protein
MSTQITDEERMQRYHRAQEARRQQQEARQRAAEFYARPENRYKRLWDLAYRLHSMDRREHPRRVLYREVLAPIEADLSCPGTPLDENELWQAELIYEALDELTGIIGKARGIVSARLGGQAALEKIARMRDPSGRTPEEAQTYREAADKLEERLREQVQS